MHTVLACLVVLVAAADPARERSPYGPSLPRLTDEEEKKLDGIIDRFVRQDIGQLKGDDARQAVKDFAALKQEAIPALIRGVNRAAKIEHSCPCVLIAKKLERLLLASDDRELLEFARDEIGCDVGNSRHKPVLDELRLRTTFRMNALARREPGGPRASRQLSVSELAAAAGSEHGPRLTAVLSELEKRDGPEVINGLATAAQSFDSEVASIGRDALDRYLARRGETAARASLADNRSEVRKSAARVVAAKLPRLARDLIPLLGDESADVREAAHTALVKLAKGKDFGPPSARSDESARKEAQHRWREWVAASK
jgi:hypothetical protein